MKKFGLILMALFCSPCHAQTPLIGTNKDAQGCLKSERQMWSQLLQKCIQPSDAIDISVYSFRYGTLLMYMVFSENKQRVEVFAEEFESGSIILEAIEDGYRSADGRFAFGPHDPYAEWQFWTLRRLQP